MKSKKFTIKDIKQYIENIGFVWIDNIIFCSKTKQYKTATIKDFNKPVLLYLKNTNRNSKFWVTVTIDDEHFIIKYYNQTTDLSKDWVECLSSKVAQGEELKV